jgi:hypothetical protein
MRRFSHEKGGGEGNFLFRPVGQVAFAQAMGILVHEKKFPIENLFEKLARFDADGGFSGMDNPESIWYGVLYDPNRKRILVAGRDLAAKLLIYILGGINDNYDRANLRKELANARTFGNQAMNFDGKFVDPKKIDLPPVLR